MDRAAHFLFVLALIASPVVSWPASATAQHAPTAQFVGQLDALTPAIHTAGLDPYAGADVRPNAVAAGPTWDATANDHVAVLPAEACHGCGWGWQLLPEGFLYRPYLAGSKESRLGIQWFHESDDGWLWDATLGGRVGLLRHGSNDPRRADAWQIDLEGSSQLRLDPETNMDLVSADFRFGIPWTFARGPWRAKFAYYHLSSHLGDEFIFNRGATSRFNYSKDAFVLGGSYYFANDVRLYAEAEWGFQTDVAEPWAFQFGVEYSPLVCAGWRGAPFFAFNTHLREETDYSGNIALQAGWQWRGRTGDVVRTGLHYYNGLSPQYSFFNLFEQQLGVGVWYDY